MKKEMTFTEQNTSYIPHNDVYLAAYYLYLMVH